MKKLSHCTKCLSLLISLGLFFNQALKAQILLHEGFEEVNTGWQVINPTNSKWDVLTGGYNSYSGDRCMYVTTGNYNKKADCWLISTPVHFEAGKKYSISFHYKCQTPQTNSMQVLIGNSINNLHNVVWNETFNNDTYLKGQVNYTAPATATQYIGFLCTTQQMLTYLYFDEVTVEEVSCFEPVNVSFSNTTTTSIKATWDKIDNASYYEYSTLSKDTSNPKKIYKTYSNAIDLTGLQPAKAYYFYVRSRCSATDSSTWAIAKFSTNYDCSTFSNLTCGNAITKNYKGGTGLYPITLCDQALNGPEFFHKFTAPHDGYYKLDCFSSGGNGLPVGFAYKPSSQGCDNSNWKCITVTVDYTSTLFGPLKAGEEYTIMEKSALETTFTSFFQFEIECYNPPPAYDSCVNAKTIVVSDYNAACLGTRLSTLGATPDNLGYDDYNACGAFIASNDDDIWVKFVSTDNTQLFRFSIPSYTGDVHSLDVNFYSKPNVASSLVDCGEITTVPGKYKDIISYYFEKGKTYYCRISTTGINNYAGFNLCIMKPGIAVSKTDSCKEGVALQLRQKDENVWIPLLDQSYKLIGAVNGGNNSLKSVLPFFYINQNNLRTDGNNSYYLDRNFTTASRALPTGLINVRLYFSNDELNKLIAQPGSHVSSLKDINVTQTDAICSSAFSKTGTFIAPYKRGSYDADNKFVEFKTDHLSSFFLHGGNTALSVGNGIENAIAATLKAVSIVVSPNPFANSINIEITGNISLKNKITVTTLDGKSVQSFEKTTNTGYNKISADLSSLAKGIYILKIENANGVAYKKIIKQ